MTHEQRLLGTVKVDARGRVYLKHVVKGLAPNSVYALYAPEDVDELTAGEGSGEVSPAPKTIRMRLVE